AAPITCGGGMLANPRQNACITAILPNSKPVSTAAAISSSPPTWAVDRVPTSIVSNHCWTRRWKQLAPRACWLTPVMIRKEIINTPGLHAGYAHSYPLQLDGQQLS